ncbi:MAG: metal ABC transporter permease, partial [Microcella pacifica]
GGILIAIGGSLPISPYITTISFAIYIVCRIVGSRRLSATSRRLSATSRRTLVTT